MLKQTEGSHAIGRLPSVLRTPLQEPLLDRVGASEICGLNLVLRVIEPNDVCDDCVLFGFDKAYGDLKIVRRCLGKAGERASRLALPGAGPGPAPIIDT